MYLVGTTLKQPDIPLDTRWYTIINVAHFGDEHASALIALADEVYNYFPSTQRTTRLIWLQIQIWYRNGIIRVHIGMIVDFGDFLTSRK